MKKIIFMLVFIFALLAVGSQSAFAGWYDCVVAKVIGRATGDVIIQIDPGAEETNFSERSRITIDADDPGANRNLAIALTAVAMGYELRIDVPNAPSFDENQTISSLGFNLPESE